MYSHLGYNQTTIAIQSFETAGDTWTPITFSTPPCTNGSDRWDYSTSLSTITPSDQNQFWGIQDLNGNCGGSGFESISLPNVDVSSCSNVTFSFDYNAIGYDNGDDIMYELFYDGVSQGQVVVVNGAGNFSTGGWITESVNIPPTVTNVSVIIYVKQNGGSDYAGIDNVLLEGDCVACPGLSTEPTINASSLNSSNIGCFSADINWSGGNGANVLIVISTSAITGTPTDGVNYNANSVYGSGDILNAGEYVIFNGTNATGSGSVTGLSMNTTYYIEIFQYNGTITNCEENYLPNGISTSFTTLNGCTNTSPQITSILYNSCNGSNEGIDEIFTFTTGSDPLEIDSIVIDYPGSAPTYCNVGCGTNTNLNNPTYVNQLNTLAGCTVFAYADPIPPNSDVMVFTGNPPSTVLDYSSQCGSSNLPVYVVFNNNTSTAGRFSNSSNTTRTLIVSFGNGMADTVSYIATSQPVTDGTTVSFDIDGNPTYFISNSCIYPLPIKLGTFYLANKTNYITLIWTTLTEVNADYFEVQKSIDGINYKTIGIIRANGNSTSEIKYNFNDNDIVQGTTYYRLKLVNFDGTFQYSYPISTNNSFYQIYYSNQLIYLSLFNKQHNQTVQVNIYNINGVLIKQFFTDTNQTFNWTEKGIFIIEIPELQIHQKFVSF